TRIPDLAEDPRGPESRARRSVTERANEKRRGALPHLDADRRDSRGDRLVVLSEESDQGFLRGLKFQLAQGTGGDVPHVRVPILQRPKKRRHGLRELELAQDSKRVGARPLEGAPRAMEVAIGDSRLLERVQHLEPERELELADLLGSDL